MTVQHWTPLTFNEWTKNGLINCLKYIFVFYRRKSVIQVRSDIRVSKWWQNFHFWMIYPFDNDENTLYTL